MKLAILSALILISLTSKISTTTINCSFDNITIPVGRFSKVQGYGCDIQSLISEETKSQIEFRGNHDLDKSNYDVTIIKYQIYDEYHLPHFDSSFCETFINTEIIFLSHLEILSVDENSLQNCQKLNKLYFYGNGIREIPEKTFSKNLKIMTLNLDSNYLSELSEALLKNLEDLEDFGLTSNQMNSLASNFFKSQTKLKFLRLARNRITAIDPIWFKTTVNLETLGFEDNMIAKVPNKTFKFLSKLIDLNLSNNSISSITSKTFGGLKSLKILNLDHNKIEDLPKNSFKDLINLEMLFIAYNKLSTIHSDSFGSLTKLTRFYCSSNQIESMDERLINNTAIVDLDLYANVCIDDSIYGREFMKNNLSDCFDNYESRIDEDEEDSKKKGEEDTNLMTEKETTSKLATIIWEPLTTIITTTQSTTTTQGLSTSELTTSSTQPTIKVSSTIKPTFKVITSTTLAPEVTPASSKPMESCGKPNPGLPTIVKGTAVVRGSFPWNAALLKTNGQFFCGGTLISRKKVITAAHCLKGKYQSHVYHAADVLVALGAHDLSKTYEVGRSIVAVRKIDNHPSWNPNIASFDADISVLELDDEITFTRFIQPICIHPGLEIEALMAGIVVGFGRSEEKSVENIARVINMPMYSYDDCSKSKEHQRLLSPRTICGGYANGTGVCVGDSGSGLYVSHNNTYYLRGIVSASLHGDLYGCNVDAYAVFTDVIKFSNWIETGRIDENLLHEDLLKALAQLGFSIDQLKNLKNF